MTITSSNLRKAAVLIRSLDADSAAGLLAQLSAAETASVRHAIRTLGPIDPDDQADILAEFRRARPPANESARRGVELSLSSQADERGWQSATETQPNGNAGKRFDFLENAPTTVLVAHLAREHAQTIAVVLSHLAPAHAAEVLAALPERLQAATIERLSVLGDTDSQSVAVLESELTAWAAQRVDRRAERGRRGDTMAAILAAADAKTRRAILDRLRTSGVALPDESPAAAARNEQSAVTASQRLRKLPNRSSAPTKSFRNAPPSSAVTRESRPSPRSPQFPAPSPQPLPRIDFDHLIHLDDRTLAAVLHEVDPNALSLALAGSGDDLVDRICRQMPKRTAKMFRRELRRLGPTRLSDVETAQCHVAQLAAQQLARRRTSRVAPVG